MSDSGEAFKVNEGIHAFCNPAACRRSKTLRASEGIRAFCDPTACLAIKTCYKRQRDLNIFISLRLSLHPSLLYLTAEF